MMESPWEIKLFCEFFSNVNRYDGKFVDDKWVELDTYKYLSKRDDQIVKGRALDLWHAIYGIAH